MSTREPDVSSAGESTVQLLIRARSGDEDAWDRLYRLCRGPLLRFAHGRLPREARGIADTDDVVQETLLRSLRGVEAFQAERTGAFLAYLRQGVLNRICDEMRRVRRRPVAGGTAGNVPDPRPLPVDEVITREVMDNYEAALQRLKPEDREAIVARLELGLSFQQIAQALGKPSPDAARVATARAIDRLAEEMAHVRRRAGR
ncbi:MAG TPA: sigma-70 family RNA polymerase sigma factor [Thermoanaerobaculia bacterium]